jgi:DNA repair exonuclease SbcCD nuclease subunit
MRILFSADHHHHPYQQFATVLPGGLSSRLAEGLAAEDFLLTLERERAVDIHVRLGDLFHQKNLLDAVTFSEVYDRIQQSSAQQYLLCGNHDQAAGGLRHGIEPFRHLRHAAVIASPCVVPYPDHVFFFLPYQSDYGDTQQAAAQFAEKARQERATTTRPLLLAFHGEIAGARTGSEYKLAGRFSLQDLQVDAYTAVLCGHIHEPQQLHPHVWYVGSLLQRSFSDEGSPRSVVLFDTDTRTGERIAVPGPRFVTWRGVTRQILDEETGLASLGPLDNTYLKVLTTDTDVTREMVERRVGSCRSLLLSYERQHASPLESFQGLATWSDYFQAWVHEAQTPLDKAALLAVGEDILSTLTP